MTAVLLAQLADRKNDLELELKALEQLLDHYGSGEIAQNTRTSPVKKKRKGCVSLPRGERCSIVVSIAKEIHEEVQRPVTLDEVKQELNTRGYRVPKNGKGMSLISAYLNAGKQMKRQGEGYVPV